jgi:hypothetical protein
MNVRGIKVYEDSSRDDAKGGRFYGGGGAEWQVVGQVRLRHHTHALSVTCPRMELTARATRLRRLIVPNGLDMGLIAAEL